LLSRRHDRALEQHAVKQIQENEQVHCQQASSVLIFDNFCKKRFLPQMDTDGRSPACARYQRLETTKTMNAFPGIRCHLCALVQAVNEVEILQEEGKAFAGA